MRRLDVTRDDASTEKRHYFRIMALEVHRITPAGSRSIYNISFMLTLLRNAGKNKEGGDGCSGW